MEEPNSELEQFRQQWRAEVSARSQMEGNRAPKSPKPPVSRKPPPIASLLAAKRGIKPKQDEEDEEDVEPRNFGLDGLKDEAQLGANSTSRSAEPQSALEHYEKAAEKESQGSLGDSINLYRKAYRMDDQVDRKYKNKHFPPSSLAVKHANSNPSNASATVPNTAHHSPDGPPQTINQLIAGFAGLSIEAAPPAIEGTPAPPCPFAELPEEITVHILKTLAILDVASFARLAQVCKRMAYLVATEDQIWRRICLGSEVGFGGMHYHWQRKVLGGPLLEKVPEVFQSSDEDELELADKAVLSRGEVTGALLHSAYSSSWRSMFRERPRIRFNGCYISTVNYIRAGQASVSRLTWQSPVHVVTYYRYLRFFRDGTLISLLTTDQPRDVVHHLTKELQETHRKGASPHLPSLVMQHALRGRWRLATAEDDPDADLHDAEGDLYVETEGVVAKYLYRMKLSLRSAGRGAKNNKLVWQGFWCYNLLTDDTGEFNLKNDKAFYWSRVKSYGEGM